MHPADEFTAFAKLIAQAKSAEDVATVFNVVTRRVAGMPQVEAIPLWLAVC